MVLSAPKKCCQELLRSPKKVLRLLLKMVLHTNGVAGTPTIVLQALLQLCYTHSYNCVARTPNGEVITVKMYQNFGHFTYGEGGGSTQFHSFWG